MSMPFYPNVGYQSRVRRPPVKRQPGWSPELNQFWDSYDRMMSRTPADAAQADMDAIGNKTRQIMDATAANRSSAMAIQPRQPVSIGSVSPLFGNRGPYANRTPNAVPLGAPSQADMDAYQTAQDRGAQMDALMQKAALDRGREQAIMEGLPVEDAAPIPMETKLHGTAGPTPGSTHTTPAQDAINRQLIREYAARKRQAYDLRAAGDIAGAAKVDPGALRGAVPGATKAYWASKAPTAEEVAQRKADRERQKAASRAMVISRAQARVNARRGIRQPLLSEPEAYAYGEYQNRRSPLRGVWDAPKQPW